MFDAILSTMANMLAPPVDDDARDDDRAIDAGPFSNEEYNDNAAAGARYETMLAVRKAHTRLRKGKAAEAMSLLENCRKRLPANAETKTLDHLIAQLREVQETRGT